MPGDPQKPTAKAAAPADQRQERLARALRDNLKKRKAQQRQRAGGPPGEDGGEDGGKGGPTGRSSGGSG